MWLPSGSLTDKEKETEFRHYIDGLSLQEKAAAYVDIMSIPSKEQLDGGVKMAMKDMTRDKMIEKYDELVTFPLYRVDGFKFNYIDNVMADSLGYAGTEIIRRTVGDSKVMEVSSVSDLSKRIPMERALVKLGIALIKNRYAIASGKEIVDTFKLIIA